MRHRCMFYATGQPGWMRFGFSPGWLGRSPTGLGPCAQFILAGRWSAPWGYWAGREIPTPPGMSKEAELTFLRAQAEWLKDQLEAISKRIEELEKK